MYISPRRGDRKCFPYEASDVAGKLLLPADVQRLHQFMLDSATIKSIPHEMREAVEVLWPELTYKLPPRERRRPMPKLALRYVRGHFVVSGPKIERTRLKTRREARDWCHTHHPGSPIEEIGADGAARRMARQI